MIEVFKTNIKDKFQSAEVQIQILKHYPELKIGFDLEDIDKVLRVEGIFFNNAKIISALDFIGIRCQVLN
jgi:hypothetical protein